jgi:hypothetical protein
MYLQLPIRQLTFDELACFVDSGELFSFWQAARSIIAPNKRDNHFKFFIPYFLIVN